MKTIVATHNDAELMQEIRQAEIIANNVLNDCAAMEHIVEAEQILRASPGWKWRETTKFLEYSETPKSYPYIFLRKSNRRWCIFEKKGKMVVDSHSADIASAKYDSVEALFNWAKSQQKKVVATGNEHGLTAVDEQWLAEQEQDRETMLFLQGTR